MLYELISFSCLIDVDPCQVFLEMADCSSWSVNDLRILRFWYKLIYFPFSLPQNLLLSHQNLSPFLTFVLDFGLHFFRNCLNFFPISYFIFIFVFYFYSFFSFIFSLAFMFHFSLSTDPSLLSTACFGHPYSFKPGGPSSSYQVILLLFNCSALYLPYPLYSMQSFSYPTTILPTSALLKLLL